MSFKTRILIASMSALFALAPISAAHAQKQRIVILDIEDSPNPKLHKSIVWVVRKARHTVISAKTFHRMARRIDARTLTSENLVRVAKTLRASGVLSGSVTEENGRYYLRLHLRSGKTGKTVQKLRLRLKRARLSAKMQRQLAKQLKAGFKELGGGQDSGASGGGDEIEVVAGVKAKTPKKKPGKKPGKKKKPGRRDKTDRGKSGGDTQVATADIRRRDRERNRGAAIGVTGPSLSEPPREVRNAAHIQIGASVVRRSMSFQLAEDFAEAPNGYNGPLAPGLNVAGEVFPLALTGLPEKGFAGRLLSGIGFGFRYDQVLGLQTSIETGATALVVPTRQASYSVGGRLRVPIGKSSSVTLAAGVGNLMFDVNRQNVPSGLVLDVPNTSYSYFDPGIAVQIAVHPKIDVGAGAQVLLITDAGDVQLPESYGAATITSYAADMRVVYRLTPSWRVRAVGSFTKVALAFSGNGEQTYLRDGDPGDQDVLGASDSYIGGILSLGYVY